MRVCLLLLCLILSAGCRFSNGVERIINPRRELKLAPAELPAARANKSYAAQIMIEHAETPIANVSIAAGELPAGLTLEKGRGESTIEISGTPKRAGQYDFKIRVACFGTQVAGQTAVKDYRMIIE